MPPISNRKHSLELLSGLTRLISLPPPQHKHFLSATNLGLQHSTGSETSFDYDEVEQELAEDVYAERDAVKRRAAKVLDPFPSSSSSSFPLTDYGRHVPRHAPLMHTFP